MTRLREDDESGYPNRDQWPLFEPEEEAGRRCLAEVAVALLLLHEIVFISGPGAMTYSPGDRSPASLWILCNDTFAYATADAEPLPQPEADPQGFWSFYDLVREHGQAGSICRVARRRGKSQVLPWARELLARHGLSP